MTDAVSTESRYKREEFIRNNLTFIRRVASRHTGRLLEWGQDEELSVALVAFNSAIDAFEYSKGENLQSFASLIIQRRLIDYYRTRSRQQARELLMGDMIAQISDEKLASPGYIDNMLAQERKREIEEYTQDLLSLDISLMDLVKQAPRQMATRRRLLDAAEIIVNDSNLHWQILDTGRIPLGQVSSLTGLGEAVLSKRRKFLLAVLYVYGNISQYPFISTYLNLGGREQ